MQKKIMVYSSSEVLQGVISRHRLVRRGKWVCGLVSGPLCFVSPPQAPDSADKLSQPPHHRYECELLPALPLFVWSPIVRFFLTGLFSSLPGPRRSLMTVGALLISSVPLNHSCINECAREPRKRTVRTNSQIESPFRTER
jgi:hypothetical protein